MVKPFSPLSFKETIITTTRAETEFQNRIRQLGGHTNYEKWQGVNKPHQCVCKEDHICHPYPANIQQGKGMCRTCAKRDPATAEQNFRDAIKAKGGTVTYKNWEGARKPHSCICKNGHVCNPYPNSIRAGQGMCYICARRKTPIT